MDTFANVLAAREARAKQEAAVRRAAQEKLYQRAMGFIAQSDPYSEENAAEMNRLCGMLHEALTKRQRYNAAQIIMNSDYPTLLCLLGVYKEILDGQVHDAGARS